MKFVDEFRDPQLAKSLVARLRETVNQPVKVMEICGTHTMAIFRYGIRGLLPEGFSLVSGPGCPVCVTPQGYIDETIQLARHPDVMITTFGDMLRVPGTEGSLLQQKSAGSDVRVVYSPLDAVQLAAENPEKEVVFLGIGFETTAPVVGLTILEAAGRKLTNYSVFSAHKVVPPVMEALVADKELALQGFLCPGHVSAVIGSEPYAFLADAHGIPAVVAGFEPLDVLQGLLHIAEMITNKQAKVLNDYSRVVKTAGNAHALAVIDAVFTRETSMWRGLGLIEGSGLAIRPEYSRFDARRRFDLPRIDREVPTGCSCGDILKGKKTPLDCRLFRTVCTPEAPVGSCMVSTEGTCAAYYKYGM